MLALWEVALHIHGAAGRAPGHAEGTSVTVLHEYVPCDCSRDAACRDWCHFPVAVGECCGLALSCHPSTPDPALMAALRSSLERVK